MTFYEVISNISEHLMQAEVSAINTLLRHEIYYPSSMKEKLKLYTIQYPDVRDRFQDDLSGHRFSTQHVEYVLLKTKFAYQCEFIDEYTYDIYREYLEYIREHCQTGSVRQN